MLDTTYVVDRPVYISPRAAARVALWVWHPRGKTELLLGTGGAAMHDRFAKFNRVVGCHARGAVTRDDARACARATACMRTTART